MRQTNYNTILTIFNNINCQIVDSGYTSLMQNRLYCRTLFDTELDKVILNATIDYILSTERIEEPGHFILSEFL